MDSQPGPSRPATAASTSSSSSSSSSSAGAASSSAVAQGAAGGRPSAFSTATRPVTGAPTAQSAVARGKQPASSVNNSAAGQRPGAAAPSTSNGPSQQRQGTTATPGSTNAGVAAAQGGPAAVSVGGPAGLVRRTVLNSILVNTRQVRREAMSAEIQRDAVPDSRLLGLHPRRTEREPRHRPHSSSPVGVRRHQMRLPSRSHRRSALPLVRSHPDLFHAPAHTRPLTSPAFQDPLPPPPSRIHPPAHRRPRRELQPPDHPRPVRRR